MKKFLFKIEKQELDEEIQFTTYSYDENQTTSNAIIKSPYIIQIKEEDFKIMNISSDKLKISSRSYQNKEKEKVIRIECSNKELFEYITKEIRDLKLKTFEGDLLEEHRAIIDKDILINPKKLHKNLSTLSFDIETRGNPLENQEILSFSIHNSKTNKSKAVLNAKHISKEHKKELQNKNANFEINIEENEEKLLQSFIKEVKKSKVQAIIGWNCIDFDLKVIKEQCKKYDIPFSLSPYSQKESKLMIRKDFFRDSTCDIEGMLVLDMIQVIKMNFIEFPDYKLDTVAKEVLGDNKISILGQNEPQKSKLEAIEDLYLKNPYLFLEYNIKDSILVTEITSKLKLLELLQKRSEMTNTPIQKVKSPIASLDIMYLKELHKLGLLANSNFSFSQESPIGGAYVIEPKAGIYENIFVFDFKSLYPSIIMTFNLDPYTFEEGTDIIAPNGAEFTSKSGILPQLILKLYELREKAKQKKDHVMSQAIKITMNSFYGAIASPKSRFHNRKIGEAITGFGKESLKAAKKFVEEKGHTVIYGDTDSIFVKMNPTSKETSKELKKTAYGLEKELNSYFETWANKQGSLKSYLTIELEKQYSQFFIASKKRYAGFDEFTSKLYIVGLEAIRGDWTPLAQEFQKELLKKVFEKSSKQEIETFIIEFTNKLESGEFDSKLIYTKKLTKPLKEYTKTTPPHVKAAREIKNFSGREVKYYMTLQGPKHISLLDEKTSFDYKHYSEKQLKGVSSDILKHLNISFDEVVSRKKQKSLSDFW